MTEGPEEKPACADLGRGRFLGRPPPGPGYSAAMPIRRLLVRAIAASTFVATVSGSVGCGYILYPERRGTQSGSIDGATMVMDLLWLLPGLVPGVVALVVDFSSGAIYVRGRAALRLAPDGRVVLRLPATGEPRRVQVRLVTAGGRVLVAGEARTGRGASAGPSLELDVGRVAPEPIFLEVRTEDGQRAILPTAIGQAG